jgi:hypothetical protein
MRRLDNLIIDGLFQPFSNLCARWWSPYDAATFMGIGYPASCVISLLLDFRYPGLLVAAFTLVASVIVAVGIVMRSHRVRERSESGRNTMNAERSAYGACFWRGAFLFNAAFFTAVPLAVLGFLLWVSLGLWFVAAANYFLACEHHPPLQRQRKAAESHAF